MFIRNKTPFQAALARERLSDDTGAAAVVVRTVHQVSSGGLVPCTDPPPPLPTDPPDLSGHPLWEGTSVTAAGDVYGPSSAPFQRVVTLAVGGAACRLLVSGDRRWTRTLGELVASAPAPFERLPLSFSLAYGGSFDVPPGLFPGTDLPFPGGRLAHPLNESGVGFYLDKEAAEGQALPNFELADQPIKQWSDRPVPGCFVPCPELPGLRVAPRGGMAAAPVAWKMGLLPMALRAHNPAPSYLVFDDLPAGTPIHLDGVGREAIRFDVPPSPVRIALLRKPDREELQPEIRSVHVDAGRGLVSCVYGYPFLYRDGHEPSWIVVEARAREGSE